MKSAPRLWLLLVTLVSAAFACNSHAAIVVPPSGPANATTGLVGWWPLNDGSGPTTLDASGNGFTGTLTGNPVWITGISTNALLLSGPAQQYITFGNGPGTAISGATSGTICGWVKTSSAFAFGFTDISGQRFGLEASGGQLYWMVENGLPSYPYCAFQPDTNWHWFALCYDASASSTASGVPGITAYIDGVAQTLTPGGANPCPALGSSIGAFTIGRALSAAAYYSMSADDVRLYNRALSLTELTNQFQWPSGRNVSAGGAPQVVTYYIDYSAGSDSNTGLSINSPWQHHPYMFGWTGSYLHQAGDHFIFRGGVIWPSNCFCMTLLGGGAPGSSDYYGVNSNWFVGNAFTRPVFDGGHWANSIVWISGYQGNNVRCVNFDSIEMRAIMCTVALGNGCVAFANTDNLTLTNCWLHDWLLTNSIAKDDAHGGFIGQFGGPYGITNIILDHTEISNAENTNYWNGVCVRMGGVINNCSVHDNSSGILFAQDVNHCRIYDICYPYNGFDPAYHFNGFYMDYANANASPAGINCYLRNSYYYNVGGGANMAYPNVEGYNCYIYNNVFYGAMSSQLAINVDTYDYGGTGVLNSCYVFNNTIVNFFTNSAGIHVAQRPGLLVSNLYIFNNHIIGPGAPYLTDASSANVQNMVASNNLVWTSSQAATQGYTTANCYAPQSASGATVGQGTPNMASGFYKNDILNRNRSVTAWDLGAYQYQNGPTPPTDLRIVSNP